MCDLTFFSSELSKFINSTTINENVYTYTIKGMNKKSLQKESVRFYFTRNKSSKMRNIRNRYFYRYAEIISVNIFIVLVTAIIEHKYHVTGD